MIPRSLILEARVVAIKKKNASRPYPVRVEDRLGLPPQSAQDEGLPVRAARPVARVDLRPRPVRRLCC